MKYIDILFDGSPGPSSPRFVEVQDESGKSINIGRWMALQDGHWALRIDQNDRGLRPDRGDGRKAHYGPGRQPYDDIKRLGWAPEFLAGSILKYLRRTKDPEHSLESARIYWRWLNDLVIDVSDEDNHIRYVIKQLTGALTPDELAKIEQ